MFMAPQNWLIWEYSKEWLNRYHSSIPLVDHLADVISIDHLLWHARSMPSNLFCFLRFLDILLRYGVSIIRPNLSIISDQLLLSPWLTIQVSYWMHQFNPLKFDTMTNGIKLVCMHSILLPVLIINCHHAYHKRYYWSSISSYVRKKLLLTNLLHSLC